MTRIWTFLLLLAAATRAWASPKQNKAPNFVFVLTDDQDEILDGMLPLTQLQKLVGDTGATFANSFVASPLCCPSRSSLLTGQYIHNHGAINNSITGECSGHGWQAGPEKRTFAVNFQEGGYTTMYAGKYLNQYGLPEVGGVEHIPPGWDSWVGLVGNSKYYNYKLSINGTMEAHGDDYETDYLTNIIRKRAFEFLDNVNDDQPFFMMLSTPASHHPFDFEPKYAPNYTERSAPRTPNFNIPNGLDKPWLLRQGIQPLPNDVIDLVDEYYRSRLRTLLTVDDMISDVVNQLESKGILSNTYVIFNSDNGYHLGQFSQPHDKRLPYETDVRVPLLITGPGIAAGSSIKYPTTNIDLAPTLLDLAGLAIPEHMDGISLKPILISENYQTERKDSEWESRIFLVEHTGDGKPKGGNPGCEDVPAGLYSCRPELACHCEDSWNSTYSCVREVTPSVDRVFCRWPLGEEFQEYYDIKNDPYQMNNTVDDLTEEEHSAMLLILDTLGKCSGTTECSMTDYHKDKLF